MKKDIIVVGAGLVGSLLALMLARRGHRVRVLEKRPDLRKVAMRAGRSINLALSERGFRALAQVSADEDVRRVALPMTGRMMHSPAGELSFSPYGKEGQAIYSVSRGALNALLMDRAEAQGEVHIAFEQRCVDVDVDVDMDSARPAVVLESGAGERRREEADVVLGADGAFSAVRLAMMMRPRFDYQQSYNAHGYKELSIPAHGDGGFALDPGALHLWPRGDYMLIALPNRGGDFTVTLFLPHESAAGGDPSFASLSSPGEVERFFAGVFPDAKALMPTLGDDFLANPTGELVTVRCAPWHVGDKVCLLGDAAHAIVPFFGQGMNAGFEDVRVLGDMLDERGDFGGLFARFFAARKPNADAIADLALENFIEMRDKVQDPRFLLRKQIEARISERYGNAYLPLYAMVTFSHLPYREAQRIGREHDALMDRIMALDDIEGRWRSPEVDALVERALGPPPPSKR